MRLLTRIGTSLLLGLGSAGALAAQAPSDEQVRDLFEAMHMQQTLGQMNAQMAGMMEKKLPCVPADYWQGFIDGDGARTVVDRMVPVFQRHFSGDEIAGLLKFYRSPLGQKMLTEMPAAMAEAMQAGQQWGQDRTKAMLADLEQKGTLDAQGRCPAAVADRGDGDEADDVAVAPAGATAHKAGKSTTRRKAAAHKAKPKGKAAAKPATRAKPASKPPAKPAKAKPAAGKDKKAAKPAGDASSGGQS